MPRFTQSQLRMIQIQWPAVFSHSRSALLSSAVAGVMVFHAQSLMAQEAAPETPSAEVQPAAQPAATSNLKGDVEDFWHFARMARYDAANAKAQAILQANAEPLDVLAAFEAAVAKRPGDDLTQGMIRFIATPEIQENAKALEALLIKGRYGRRAQADFIESNIQRLIVNQIGYQNGVANLRSSGEMAVPILLEYLRASDKSQYHDAARRALKDLGRVALNPLVASTEMADAETLSYVITILGELQYADAAPYVMRIQATSDSAQIKEACAQALQKMNASGDNPGSAFLALADKFYYGRSAISADTRNPSAFIWYWDEGTGLTRKDVPQEVFGEIMAMRASEYALQLAGEGETGDKALSLWLASNYKRQVQLGQTPDPTRAENQPDAHYYGVTSGPKYLGMALDRTLTDNDAAVSYEMLRSAQQIVGNKTLNIQGEGQSLVKAMNSPDRRVRFEAAFALAAARPDTGFSGADMVVPLLGEALSQTGKPTVVIIAASQDKVNAITEPLTAQGYTVVGATSVANALDAARPLPAVDVVVFDSTLPSDQIQGIVESLSTAPKLRGSARLALVQTTQSVFEELKQRDPLLSTSTATDPDGIKAAIEAARTRGGALPVDPQIATDYSLRAAGLLKQIGTTGGVYDLASVKPTLLGSLNDERPEVVKAVGEVLTQYGDADAQRALLARAAGNADAELRISLYKSLAANAKQFGNMLPAEDAKELQNTVTTEPDLAIRSAAAEARGSLNLPAAEAKAIVLEQIDR